MRTEHRTDFKQPMKRGLNDGPFIDKTRCDGVLVGGARCRKTNGVESCLCGCTLNLCPECMGSSSKASPSDWNRIDAVTGTPQPVPAPPTRTEEPTEAEISHGIAVLAFTEQPGPRQDYLAAVHLLALEALRLRGEIEQVRGIVQRVAAMKWCEEDDGECESDSGPYCTVHGDNYMHIDLIRKCRSLLPPERP